MAEVIRGANRTLLADFRTQLLGSGLGLKAADRHIEQVSFFINECLLSDETPRTAAEGVRWVDYYLGYWFIRKAAWASPRSIRSNATSIRKFYGFMAGAGLVSDGALEVVLDQIRFGLKEWIRIVEVFNDPDADLGDDS
jgi:hypothetical protein